MRRTCPKLLSLAGVIVETARMLYKVVPEEPQP